METALNTSIRLMKTATIGINNILYWIIDRFSLILYPLIVSAVNGCLPSPFMCTSIRPPLLLQGFAATSISVALYVNLPMEEEEKYI